MEKKKYQCRTFFGTTEVWLTKKEYANNHTLHVQAWCEDGPFATITVNIPGGCAGDNFAYVDTNNCPWAPEFLEENGLATNTGIIGYSGYCAYPLFNFNVDKI